MNHGTQLGIDQASHAAIKTPREAVVAMVRWLHNSQLTRQGLVTGRSKVIKSINVSTSKSQKRQLTCLWRPVATQPDSKGRGRFAITKSGNYLRTWHALCLWRCCAVAADIAVKVYTVLTSNTFLWESRRAVDIEYQEHMDQQVEDYSDAHRRDYSLLSGYTRNDAQENMRQLMLTSSTRLGIQISDAIDPPSLSFAIQYDRLQGLISTHKINWWVWAFSVFVVVKNFWNRHY